MKYIAYVGHQTDDKNEGIRIMEADAETGRFRQRRLLHVPNAIYMAINRAKTRLYTSFSDPAFGPRGKSGGLAAYAIKGDDLVKINALGTGASTPCHVSLAPDEKALVYAEYGGATAGFVELADDGALKGPAVQTCITDPAGPNKPRQDKPHAHCAIVSPDSKNLCVVDLGVDQVKVYDWADRANGLKEIPSRTIHTTPAGAGPRHILFHPNGKLAFVIFELENYVTSYRYDGESFRPVQQLPLLPAGFTDFSKAAAIKLSEDGTGDLVIRLYESMGGTRTVMIHPFLPFSAVCTCSFAEDPQDILPVSDGTFTLSFHPFQIITLRLARKR